MQERIRVRKMLDRLQRCIQIRDVVWHRQGGTRRDGKTDVPRRCTALGTSDGLFRKIETKDFPGSLSHRPCARPVTGGTVNDDLPLGPLRHELVSRQMLVLGPGRKASAVEHDPFALDAHG